MNLSKLSLALTLVILIWFAIVAFMIYLHIDHSRPEDSLKHFIGIVFGASVFITMPVCVLYAECLYRRILPKVDKAIGENNTYDSHIFDYDLSIKSFLKSLINTGGMIRYSKLINYATTVCNPWIERLHRKQKYHVPVDFGKLPKNLRIPLIIYFYWIVLEVLLMILAGIFLYDTF